MTWNYKVDRVVVKMKMFKYIVFCLYLTCHISPELVSSCLIESRCVCISRRNISCAGSNLYQLPELSILEKSYVEYLI